MTRRRVGNKAPARRDCPTCHGHGRVVAERTTVSDMPPVDPAPAFAIVPCPACGRPDEDDDDATATPAPEPDPFSPPLEPAEVFAALGPLFK